MQIGILALQGDFELHQTTLNRLEVKSTLIRKPSQLVDCDGLIIPGGESTTLVKLLRNIELIAPIRHFATHRPIFGTCAGSILLATEIANHSMETLGLIEATIERNAYGRQIDSFIYTLQLNLNDKKYEFEGVFIRAPEIKSVGQDVKVLGVVSGQSEGENIVLAENDQILIATFHPELTQDDLVHRYFIDKVRTKSKN
ncbi:MAG: pyridoxal 5'-phosphate synthase glutaminase subunit PdxT [Candidatus Poribacteria bacterium]|jgi:5'-phosphate synthase pdxT subunit|nr:pyridoxal 5'-phosphate synthase glutaminase subunit PdxT [Candidatus Poribacteria bacterium]MDP6745873.1 pyridoxal 5'-phosphate synthase glutaminase subunit PdxT [Candidatus Poribacteria bacterium]MDP6997241.1 pyridoxal 5'-phosphate synthase glutaminase subunit PdxT [Candidatus Poribacteria bacterium]